RARAPPEPAAPRRPRRGAARVRALGGERGGAQDHRLGAGTRLLDDGRRRRLGAPGAEPAPGPRRHDRRAGRSGPALAPVGRRSMPARAAASVVLVSTLASTGCIDRYTIAVGAIDNLT